MSDDTESLTGTYTAVVDRFENDVAVLVVEIGGERAEQALIDKQDLHEDGRHIDAVYSLSYVAGTIDEIQYQASETRQRKQSSQNRFDRLSRRLGSESEDDME